MERHQLMDQMESTKSLCYHDDHVGREAQPPIYSGHTTPWSRTHLELQLKWQPFIKEQDTESFKNVRGWAIQSRNDVTESAHDFDRLLNKKYEDFSTTKTKHIQISRIQDERAMITAKWTPKIRSYIIKLSLAAVFGYFPIIQFSRRCSKILLLSPDTVKICHLQKVAQYQQQLRWNSKTSIFS